THDLGLAASYCDRVVVMEKGRVVEAAPSREIFTAPSHPYTRKLMRATPRPGVSLRDLLPEDDFIATSSGVRGLQTYQEGVTALPIGEGAHRRCSRVELNLPADRTARARAHGEASKPQRRCWWWRSWSRNIRARGSEASRESSSAGRRRSPRPSARWTASALPSTAARASAWSESPAAASRRPPRW